MNYLIIGNIASGKTSLAQSLSQKLNSSTHSIDNLRLIHSDGTFAGEFRAWAEMLEVIQHPDPVSGGIYEFSGTGKNAWFVREAIRYSQINHDSKWATVYCLCDKGVLLKRCENRKYSIPIPYKFTDISSSINFMSKELQKNYGQEYWNSPEFTVRTDLLSSEKAAEAVLQWVKENT